MNEKEQEEADILYSCFARLTFREQAALKLRFGLDEVPEHTLGWIARRHSLSRARIRAIILAALRKLRQKMQPYLDESHRGKKDALKRWKESMQWR